LTPEKRKELLELHTAFMNLANTTQTKGVRVRALRDAKSIEKQLNDGMVRCHCGEYYNPRMSLFHGKRHLFI